jgi:hypothetical protein
MRNTLTNNAVLLPEKHVIPQETACGFIFAWSDNILDCPGFMIESVSFLFRNSLHNMVREI